MCTRFIFLLSLCCCQSLPAQTVLTGKVLDAESGDPLYFATVTVAGQPYGTLSREDGSFELNTLEKLDPQTTISASYLGYATEKYRLADLVKKGEIRLRPAGVGLSVINVGATGDLTEIELGRKERKAFTFYQSAFDQTYQLASRVSNPEQRAGILTAIRYYFGKAAKKGKPVRLNFYAVDPACDCPGEPLHAVSIIPDKTKSGWNRLDLTSDRVYLPAEDFFIAFEWLGLGTMNSQVLNFSVGIVPDKNAAPIYEKIGGADWTEAVKRGPYRPLVQVLAKVE